MNELRLDPAFITSALNQAAIVAVTDVKGDILHCNDMFCAVSGYAREELLGLNHRILNSGVHSTAFFRKMYRSIARGQIWRGSICNRRKQGDLYWVDTTIVPQMGADGKPNAYLAIRFEVSAHKQALADLDEARERAETAAKSKGRFLATMSHELRTPLTGVVGLTELLASTSLDDRQRDYVDSLLEAARALQAIVNDVLNLAKTEAGILIQIAPLHPSEVVRSTVRLLEPIAAKKAIALTLNCATDLPEYVTGDAERLRQVLVNLIGNSLKFTDVGEVTVSVDWSDTERGGRLRFCVKDTGPGFSPDLRDRLFEPFEQGDNSTSRAHEGAGLGLAISANLVKAMGGRIEAESGMGQGAEFWFEVPAEIAEPAAPTTQARTLPTGGALDILVAEDNAILRRLVQAILESAGHACTLVENGAAAVELMRMRPFDLCLMDIRMPVMDGLTALRTIQAQPPAGWPTPPIIALSADILDDELADHEALGFSGFVAKPIDTAALLQTIASAAERTQSPACAARSQDDLSVVRSFGTVGLWI